MSILHTQAVAKSKLVIPMVTLCVYFLEINFFKTQVTRPSRRTAGIYCWEIQAWNNSDKYCIRSGVEYRKCSVCTPLYPGVLPNLFGWLKNWKNNKRARTITVGPNPKPKLTTVLGILQFTTFFPTMFLYPYFDPCRRYGHKRGGLKRICQLG